MTQSLSARFQSLRVALLSTCALAVVGPAWAQNQPSTTSANQQIEEIVVRGISLSLQKAVEDKRAAEPPRKARLEIVMSGPPGC